MVLVKVLFVLVHGQVVAPGLRYHHHQAVGQGTSSGQQQLQGIVEAGGVALHVLADNWEQPLDILPQGLRREHMLPGRHPVDVAPEGVDLAVMDHETVGVCQFPGAQRVCAEPGVHQYKRRHQVLVGQIVVEPLQLRRHNEAFVDNLVG